mmetsp:Transcript_12726/g.15371  ORF Transcript_12726/g.15371 Transcript_12726/m.15371 type:complete len:227 (-) Transcript_12726:85-765(-)|eukprot:CAMPEP_0197855352 /NCGR_PEP_ID=MMETSP1438-20131217/26486_1 /TAXON_ID=1461541 /ORGANISM="Pterosperma sp., Strain CCMP1384" /LENGTH=226 /DNA_ID=CAMNT_0043470433 /DNA_START=200 /DNA_END=880 /DNA_ORIENTATION=-
MTNHLSHALPWNALNEALVVDRRDPNVTSQRLVLHREKVKILNDENDRTGTDNGLAAWKKVQHFARCVATQVEEFRSTDKWRDVDKIDPRDQEAEKTKFDHTSWDNFRNMWCMPEEMSVLCGYIDINMLLLDEKKWRPLLSDRYSLGLQQCKGDTDRGHPDWLAIPLREAFNEGGIRKLDEEVSGILLGHAKKLFQVMYRSPLQDAEKIAKWIALGYGVVEYVLPA